MFTEPITLKTTVITVVIEPIFVKWDKMIHEGI